MSHHEWKALERERDDLMVALMNQPRQVNNIVTWLEDQIIDTQEMVDAKDNHKEAITTDGTDDIYIGRHECATALLEQIKKWEKE